MASIDPPWASKDRLLETSLSADDCFRQLEPNIGWAGAFGKTNRPLRGWSQRSGFTIYKSTRYRNPFQTRAVGTYEPSTAGTRIRVRLGLPPMVLVFLCCWCGVFGLAALFFLLGGNVAARSPAELLGLARIVGALLGLALIGVVLFVVGRVLAWGEAAFLIRFLADTLGAREVHAS